MRREARDLPRWVCAYSSKILRSRSFVTSGASAAARRARQNPRTTTTSTTIRPFSSTRTAMAGSKIDGNAIAKGIREKLNAQIKQAQQSNPRYQPSLVIIQGESLSIEVCTFKHDG